MRPRARWLLAAAAGLLPPAATGQTLDEILTRHLAARGGAQALAAVRTVVMTGQATASGGRRASVRREIARPGRIRTEFVFQGTTGVYAWDGTQGWRVSPLDGNLEPELIPEGEASVAAEQADLDGPLVDWKAKGHAVELEGREDLSSGPAHRLKVTLRSGTRRQVWIDAGSGLLVRSLTTRVRRSGREVALETVFGDHRDTGGVVFARRVEIGVPGRPRRLLIVVDGVAVNLPLDASRFAFPR